MHGSHFGDATRLTACPTASVEMPRLSSNGSRMTSGWWPRNVPSRWSMTERPWPSSWPRPADLTDLAIGFSLTEGIIEDVGEIDELDGRSGSDGIELRMWLRPECGRLLKERQRRLVGPTGCGLCGIESLREASRIIRPVERQISLRAEQIERRSRRVVATRKSSIT